MPKPSKQIIIDAIIKGIEQGKERGNLLATIGKKWQLSQRTFDRHWKTANDTQKERQQKASKAVDKVYIETKVEAAKTGLKSKLEKQLHIQKEIDGIQSDIDRGILEDYVILGGKLQTVKKIMNAETKAYLRKTMKDLYAELNKMEGDYAPTKVANTDKDGNDVAPLSEKQVDKILDIVNSLK
jgi:hypothetical protein